MWPQHNEYENIQRKSEKCPSIEENSPEVENIYKAKDKGAGKTYVKVNYKQQEKILLKAQVQPSWEDGG